MTNDTTLSYATESLDEHYINFSNELPEGTVITDEVDYRLMAQAVDAACFDLATQHSDLSKSILYLMFEMEKHQYYRVHEQEFTSLKEWSKFRFAKLYDMESITEDFVARLVTTVMNLLMPVQLAYARGESKVDPVDLITNASPTQLKELPFYFTKAEPDEQLTLLEVMSEPAPDLGDRRKKNAALEKLKDKIAGRTQVSVTLVVTVNYDGSYHVEGDISEEELNSLTTALGRRLNLKMAA